MKFLKIEGLDFEVAEFDAPYALDLKNALKYAKDNDADVPTADELHQIYMHKSEIPNLTDDWYWSSTETSHNLSRIERFSDGSQGYTSKYYSYVVRLVRR